MTSSNLAHRRSLWLAALAGPVAWSTYFLAGYSVLEADCRLPLLSGSASRAGVTGVPIVLVLTVVTLLVCAYGGWLALGHWRRLAGLDAETERFMAVSGILLNGLFGFMTIAHALPTLILAPCW